MNLLQKNITANFLGSTWQALIGLIFVPFYIKFMGIESWGLVGFFITLQAIFGLLDMGLTSTLNRELARLSVLPQKEQEMRNLVRTLEMLYWGIALIVGMTTVLLSPFLAHHWIKAGALPVQTIKQTLVIMGFALALQMPVGFYSGGLMGLQKQVLLNVTNVCVSTLRGGGAVSLLWLVAPTIQIFFLWQIIMTVIHVFLLALFLWRQLPLGIESSVFEMQLLKNTWRFAAGMSGIFMLATILTQLDKIILSKMLSLEMFGYYILAGLASSVIPILLGSPVFNALFPRFTSLAAVNDNMALKLLYHQGSQLMATLALPVAAVLAFFSFDILLLWTGSVKTANAASPIVSILVIGMALNCLMVMPYALQLSHGWTSIGLRINTLLIVILVPAIYFMTTRYGAMGAAAVWVVLNSIYMLIGVPFTHRRLLKGEMSRWFIEDTLPPFGAALLVGGTGRWLIPSPMPPLTAFISLTVILLTTLMASALVAPHMRTWILLQLKTRIMHV